jgi:hypothetical protein
MPAPKKRSSGSSGKKEDEVDKNRRIIRKYVKHYETLCSEASQVKTDLNATASSIISNADALPPIHPSTTIPTYTPYQPLITKLLKLAKSEDGPPLDLSTIPLIITPPPALTQQDLSLFLQSLSVYPHYSHLSFIRTNFSDSGTIVLAQFLKPNPLITKLELIDNHIGSLGCKHLSRALQHNEVLRILNLDFNPIGDEGCSLLSVGLVWSSSLKTLSLQYCQIGPVGVMSFAEEVIIKNQSLTSIDLTGNQLGVDGITYLAKALPTANPHLQSLNLSATCSFKDDGESGYLALDKLATGIEEQGMEKIRAVLQKQQEEEEESARIDREKQEKRDSGEYVPTTSRDQKKKPAKKKSIETLLGEEYLTELNLHLNPLDKRCAQRLLEMLQKRRTISKLKLHEQVDAEVFKQIVKEMLTNREKAIKRAKLLAKMKRKKKGGGKKKKASK